MKKYLFIWSFAIGLLVSAQAQALVCEEEVTCEKMGYTVSTEDVGTKGADYTCTACPLDGSKWSCASIAPVTTGGQDIPVTPDNPDDEDDEDDEDENNDDDDGGKEVNPTADCSGYPYICQEIVNLYPAEEGYKHYACPPSKDTTDNNCTNSSPSTKYMVKDATCPAGYSTKYAAKCEKEEQTVTYTNCYYAWIYSSGGPIFDSTGFPLISDECLSEPPTTGQYQVGSVPHYAYQSWCKNSSFVSQFSSAQIADNYESCIANNTQERLGWRRYRCQKGMSGGKPCLSSFTVMGYSMRLYMEPCAVLHNATPDNNCLYQ